MSAATFTIGLISDTHGLMRPQALAALPESQFVAVCDAQLSRAQACAHKFGVAAFDSVPQML